VAPAAAAAVLVVAVGSTLVMRRSGHMEQLAEDLIADHLSSVPEVKPAEIASSDRADVVRFFAEHLPFAAVVPELPGTQLLGARLCRIEGRRVELLFYRRENRTLSLFVTDSPVAAGQCWAGRGHHVCSRSDAKLTFLLVGELPADELRRLLDESLL
jgi:anti-sigma factor RsiW